ncbi:hypothetical protein [Nocardioides sp.]|uniref:hypothetical protein n=1 Tax=Nocardioides sp. TaxID=35761 RepID=UPI003513D42B
MAREDDDDVWRAIVENFGDRAEIDDEPVAPPAPEPVDLTAGDDEADGPFGDPFGEPEDVEGFVPPAPPPLPRLPPDRLAAWCGVFGSPALLLLCLIAGVDLPSLLAYAMVIGFVGGFLYLVVTMSREPRDPWDDGAVL